MRTRAFTWMEFVVALAVSAIATAVLYPIAHSFFVQSKTNCGRVNDLSNMKQIALGVAQYGVDFDDHVPLAANWMDALLPYTKNKDLLRCHEITNATANDQYGHALHEPMVGIAHTKVSSPATEVLFLDSADLWRNAVSDLSRLPKAPRYKGQNVVAYFDGHVRAINPKAAP